MQNWRRSSYALINSMANGITLSYQEAQKLFVSYGTYFVSSTKDVRRRAINSCVGRVGRGPSAVLSSTVPASMGIISALSRSKSSGAMTIKGLRPGPVSCVQVMLRSESLRSTVCSLMPSCLAASRLGTPSSAFAILHLHIQTSVTIQTHSGVTPDRHTLASRLTEEACMTPHFSPRIRNTVLAMPLWTPALLAMEDELSLVLRTDNLRSFQKPLPITVRVVSWRSREGSWVVCVAFRVMEDPKN